MAVQRWRGGRVSALCAVYLAVLLTGLTACGVGTSGGVGVPTPTTAVSTPTSGPLGTIAGNVVAGPTCPVEQAENPCPPAIVPNRQVLITTPSGALVATTTTDAAGRFTVRVPPGSYRVQVAIVPGQIGLRQVSPGDVTVVANQVTTVQIELDTGIR